MIKDPIKEIFEQFEDKISSFKREREEALLNFKNVVHIKKIEDVKMNLKSNAVTKSKK